MSVVKWGIALAVAGLSVLLAACSAQELPSAGSPPALAPASSVTATTPPGPEVADLGELRLSLERAGLRVGGYRQDTTKLDKEAVPLFPGAPLHPYVLEVGGAAVMALRYPTSDEASRVAARINRKDPFPAIEFTGMPHVFLHDRALVFFNEERRLKAAAARDSRILSVLRSQFGTDYASAL